MFSQSSGLQSAQIQRDESKELSFLSFPKFLNHQSLASLSVPYSSVHSHYISVLSPDLELDVLIEIIGIVVP